MRFCFRRLPFLAALAALLLLCGCSSGKISEATETESPAPTVATSASPAPKAKTHSITKETPEPTPEPKPEPTLEPTPGPTPEPTLEPTPEVILLPLDAPETEIPDIGDRAIPSTDPEPQTETYVLNTNTKKFHRPGCQAVDKMKEKNKRIVESTREDVIASDYVPCKICKP